jgi:hypothetical protein
MLNKQNLIFFFYTIGEQEDRTGPAWKGRGRFVPVVAGRRWEKGVGG